MGRLGSVILLVVVLVAAGCGQVPGGDGAIQVEWELLFVTLSVDTNGDVDVAFSSPSIPTPLGNFRVGVVADPASYFKDQKVGKVLIVRFNGEEQYFDLTGKNVNVSFAQANYEAITVATRDGNVLVDVRSTEAVSYSTSGAAPAGVGGGSESGSLLLTVNQRATIFTTAGSTLAMHDSPGTSATIVNRLHSGLVVTVLEGPVSYEGYRWWRIESPDGPVGWVVEWLDGYQMLLPGIPPTPVAPRTSGGIPSCGGKVARFTAGETVVVSLRGDDLLILQTYTSSKTGLGMAVAYDQLRIEDGPECYFSERYQQDVMYWYVYAYTDNVYGWVADGITNEWWLCPTTNTGCDQ